MNISKIYHILRCYAVGMGIREISLTFCISRNTVRKYVRLIQDCGVPIELLLTMSKSHLFELFVGGTEQANLPSPRRVELDSQLPDYAARLRKKKVTVKSLYEEYHAAHPDGYSHAAFGIFLRQYRLQTRPIGHVEHYAGDQLYIDFAGDKLSITHPETRQKIPVEVFVAILPCSHYTYCEAVRSQRKEDLIRACQGALFFYGGAPKAIVPDNLKAAVTRSDRNEPIINNDFELFAEHFGCVVYPARVRHPKDKALVENAVKLLYRSVYEDIKDHEFESLEALNAALHKSLEAFNARKMTNRNQSRLELFDQMERDYLRPLPAKPFQLKERKSVTVQRNSFVTLFKHHYSVPQEWVGKRVEVVYDADRVEIYHGLRLITTHQRDDSPFAFSQHEAHQLPGRQGSYERDLLDLFAHAADIDARLADYLKAVAQQKRYTPVAFRSCRGILSLERKYGRDRLIAACRCAAETHQYGYNEVAQILKNGDEVAYMPTENVGTAAPSPIDHTNIRGRDYFGPNNQLNYQSFSRL